jgi:heme-degrading monooxygenase HmoA
MYLVIVHHWSKPGMLAATRELVDKVGNDMVSVPGFCFRHRIEQDNDLDKVSTLTAWDNEEAFEAYRKSRKPPALDNPAVPFHRYERELYTVKSTAGTAPR